MPKELRLACLLGGLGICGLGWSGNKLGWWTDGLSVWAYVSGTLLGIYLRDVWYRKAATSC
jgi:hypothetical protein